jgi:hypothetical protein
MPPSASSFVVSHSFRLPGLGLLVVPALPAPAWLASPDLHTALALQLHRPDYPPLRLTATIEELNPAEGPPSPALLLDADPGVLLPGAWLELVRVVPQELQ